MNQEPVRAKDQMGKAHDLVLRGKQDYSRPVVELIPMTKAQRLEARRAVSRGRDYWRAVLSLSMAMYVRRLHDGTAGLEPIAARGPGSQGPDGGITTMMLIATTL